MKTIDTRGRLCPEPLIMTKRAIAQAGPGDEFEVLTDNAMACSNLGSYLTELGIAYRLGAAGPGEEVIRFTLASDSSFGGSASMPEPVCEMQPQPAVAKVATGDYCVAVGSDRMGRGDDGLGKILLRAFINSLGEAERLPSHILFYNSGINAALEGSDTIPALRDLKTRGVDILVCGTCLDFYEAKERLAIGAVSNMFKITEVLSKTGHVVYP